MTMISPPYTSSVKAASSDLTDPIAGKVTSVVSAISCGSNFTFPRTRECEIDAKKWRSDWPGSLGETNRARYALVNLYANFTELPLRRMALGKLRGSSFRRKSYDFRPTVAYRIIRRPPFHDANFDFSKYGIKYGIILIIYTSII